MFALETSFTISLHRAARLVESGRVVICVPGNRVNRNQFAADLSCDLDTAYYGNADSIGEGVYEAATRPVSALVFCSVEAPEELRKRLGNEAYRRARNHEKTLLIVTDAASDKEARIAFSDSPDDVKDFTGSV